LFHQHLNTIQVFEIPHFEFTPILRMLHPVTVVSSFPLGEIIRNPDAAGRIAKWSVELMGETLAYAPRKAIKSQILADFVAEWMNTQLPPPQI
jgi:hypothetical protein